MNQTQLTKYKYIREIKSGILLFFGTWFFIAFLTNFFDGLHSLDYLNLWKFRSGNFNQLLQVFSFYQVSPKLTGILFTCDIIVQGISSILFYIAFSQFYWNKKPWPWINCAFGISIALWGVFLIMEEVFIAYGYEGTHIQLAIFELISFAIIHLIPSQQ